MMKENDQELRVLENVQRVQAPPFLLTRIESRIEASIAERVPLRRVIAASFILVIVFAFNTYVFVDKLDVSESSSTAVSLVDEMGIGNSNHLYDE